MSGGHHHDHIHAGHDHAPLPPGHEPRPEFRRLERAVRELLVAMIERADAAAARFAADLQLTTAARLRTGYDKPAQPRLPGMPGTGAAVEAGAPPKLKVVG